MNVNLEPIPINDWGGRIYLEPNPVVDYCCKFIDKKEMTEFTDFLMSIQSAKFSNPHSISIEEKEQLGKKILDEDIKNRLWEAQKLENKVNELTNRIKELEKEKAQLVSIKIEGSISSLEL